MAAMTCACSDSTRTMWWLNCDDLAGRPVQGHSVRKWRNRLAMWREVVDTLATCLGGRSAGFDLYELMPRQMQ